MAQKKSPELVDIVAEALGVNIVDREAFTKLVNDALVSLIAPRLYAKALEQLCIISPKKASDDPGSTGGVTST